MDSFFNIKYGKHVPILCGEHVPIDDFNKAVSSPKFIKWLGDIEKGAINNDVVSIVITKVDMFGPKNVGFIHVYVKTHSGIPGIVVIRGATVAMLVVLIDQNTAEKYVLLVEQPRIPIGDWFLEIPAGMMDSNDNFVGAAAKEINEETGITIKSSDLKDLFGEKSIAFSCGLLDETCKFFYIEIEMSSEDIKNLHDKMEGNREEGEIIRLKVYKLEKLYEFNNLGFCLDSKLVIALHAYKLKSHS